MNPQPQTKTFVATLLALRVHQHSLKLSSKVRAFFPASDKPGIGAAMTLQDLASHHSGLPRPAADHQSGARNISSGK